MAKTAAQKLEEKRSALVDRMACALSIRAEEAIELLRIGRVQSVRLNPLRADARTLDAMKQLGWNGKQFEWFAHGYTVEAGLAELRDSDLAANGQIYIQNAASWLPVLALDPQPGERILDVCAAPGGKTSHIAAQTNNQALITANDNSRPRLAKLRANMERLGVRNVECTLFDASQIARKLEGRQFDKILLDAPCSGEGMMTFYDESLQAGLQFGSKAEHHKGDVLGDTSSAERRTLDQNAARLKARSDKDFATWSVAQVKRLQQLQKRLITQAWQLLKPGGTLLYSTCTMGPEENEAVVDFLLRKNQDAQIVPLVFDLPNRYPAVLRWNEKRYDERISLALRLAPSLETEAFFVVALVKAEY